jgi:hypothetical protein
MLRRALFTMTTGNTNAPANLTSPSAELTVSGYLESVPEQR